MGEWLFHTNLTERVNSWQQWHVKKVKPSTERRVLTRKNCFASATKNLENVNGRMKLTRKSIRPNIKNGNAKVMLLKSQPMKNQPEVAVVLVVVPKLFPQQMVAHVFSLFMEAVVMVLVSQWTKV